MPNFDGGHYFLTVLAPVKPGAEPDPVTGASRSHRHLLMQALSLMPLSEITEASKVGKGATNSPFARTTCTHLARFVVIDAPAFNGRESGDYAARQAPRRPFKPVDKLTAQPVDRLSSPYLLFAADFDADRGDDADTGATIRMRSGDSMAGRADRGVPALHRLRRQPRRQRASFATSSAASSRRPCRSTTTGPSRRL